LRANHLDACSRGGCTYRIFVCLCGRIAIEEIFVGEYKFVIRTEDEGTTSEEQIEQGLAATYAAARMNVLYFQRNPEASCALSQGKIKYDSENKDVLSMIGEISTAPILISEGKGLCIDIVAFDVAARMFEGYQAWPSIFSRGGGIFHVVTHILNGKGNVIEYDPSAELESRGLISSYVPKVCRR